MQSRWSSKEKNWRSAEHKARQLEQQLEDILTGRSRPDAKTIKEAVELFLTSKRNENLAADTVYRHEQIMRSLAEFCDRQGILFIKDVTLAHLTMWQSEWTLKAPQARRSRQEKVRNFFKYCLANSMIATNPAVPEHWKSVKVKFNDQNVRALDPKEYEKILSSIELTKMTDTNKARIKALMQLQRWSGLSLVDAVCLSGQSGWWARTQITFSRRSLVQCSEARVQKGARFEFANKRHAHSRGMQCKASSGSAQNHRPPGYTIPYGELPNSTLRHTFDTSSRLGVTLAGAGVRTTREPAAGVDSLLECGSRRLLSYLLDKCLLLFTGQELKEPGDRVQQQVWISVVQVCSRQEIRADHLQAVATAICHSPVCSIRYISCQPPILSLDAAITPRS